MGGARNSRLDPRFQAARVTATGVRLFRIKPPTRSSKSSGRRQPGATNVVDER
jgi:hypothetical protein